MTTIDLNADLGEGEQCDEQLLAIVTSCNVACGGHAGNSVSMEATLRAAERNDIVVGAHPSYPDRDGFGRRSQFVRGRVLRESIRAQLLALQNIALTVNVDIAHIKPHGALYNDVADDAGLARDLVAASSSVLPNAALVGLPDSRIAAVAEESGVRFYNEGFVDRAYQPDGRLVPRSNPGAVHSDIPKMTEQAIALLGSVDTLCIHGDTPNAVDIAAAVRQALIEHGVDVRALTR